jgi:hypothetical protein
VGIADDASHTSLPVDAGTDALELNLYTVAADPRFGASDPRRFLLLGGTVPGLRQEPSDSTGRGRSPLCSQPRSEEPGPRVLAVRRGVDAGVLPAG